MPLSDITTISGCRSEKTKERLNEQKHNAGLNCVHSKKEDISRSILLNLLDKRHIVSGHRSLCFPGYTLKER